MCRKMICLLSFVLLAALNSNAPAGLIDDSSLVMYYSFDSVTDIVADQSGNGHDGVVNGDVTAESVGKYGGAANFASGSFLDLEITMRSIVIIGNSTSKVYNDVFLTQRGYKI